MSRHEIMEMPHPGANGGRSHGGDTFVFARATDHRATDEGGSGGALGRHAVAVEARDALVAPILATWSGAALWAAETGPDLLTTYTSGRGEHGVTSGFNITIDFEGTWTAALQARFVQAAEYLSSIIRGDVKDRPGIDDLAITATLTDIDGAGGVLGQAGPTELRLGNKLPFAGVMEFDAADAASYDRQGLFDDIVTHEMLHTLGFGTVWGKLGLTSGSVAKGNAIFTGASALKAFHALYPRVWDNQPATRKGIPVETEGGSGTAGSHWDDATFRSELMTGYINNHNQLSTMTVAALEDMGYDTVFRDSHPTRSVMQLDDLQIA